MKIQVLGQKELRLYDLHESGWDIELVGKIPHLSALALWVACHARCTFAVIDHYGLRIDVDIENIVMRLSWEIGGDPHVYKSINMEVYWPELPEKRVASVERAAHQCTISRTIGECVEVSIKAFNKADTPPEIKA